MAYPLSVHSESMVSAALDQLVEQSRRVGADDSLVLWGGGNNSLKTTGLDLLGNRIPVMYVKGSGSDMKSIVASEYPAVRLDWILPLMNRESMSDEEMVDYLARCLLDPKMRRPSIETLLHAFLPYASVLHTHADDILALTNTEGREATVRACFGDRVLTVDYLRPGFALSRRVGELATASREVDGIVLMNHGLITWGDTADQAWERHLALVERARGFVAQKRQPASAPDSTIESRQERDLAPSIRGAVLRHRPMVLEHDVSSETLAFCARPDLERITQIGPATPDHLLHMKRFPLLLDGRMTKEDVVAAFDRYEAGYREYFESHASGEVMLDPLPRVVLVPGAGMWTIGRDARAARIVRDIYRHTMRIIEAATSLGGFATLSPGDAFGAEYWPLELYKLTLLPKERELASRIVVVTGAAGAIGRAIARRFAAEGAHLILHDLPGKGQSELAEEIITLSGARRAVAIEGDLTRPDDVARIVHAAVDSFGGVDIVVSNAGIAAVGAIDELDPAQWEKNLAVNTTAHFLLAREAMRVMKQQGAGGVFVFNATKNVTAPGRDFGAYSVSKAAEAQLCRIVAIEGGAHGIRANMLNPDAIFENSSLWSDELRRQRAESYGVTVEALGDFYRKRNLLSAAVTAEDVAEAALFLASDRSAKTTGAMIPVDGGVREAFPR